MLNDLISRQAAIEAIYAEARLANSEVAEEYAEVYAYALRGVPSAQPEPIRCKDCKNWDTTWTNDYAPNYHYCPMVDGTRRGDFYCADAERRTDG